MKQFSDGTGKYSLKLESTFLLRFWLGKEERTLGCVKRMSLRLTMLGSWNDFLMGLKWVIHSRREKADQMEKEQEAGRFGRKAEMRHPSILNYLIAFVFEWHLFTFNLYPVGMDGVRTIWLEEMPEVKSKLLLIQEMHGLCRKCTG